MAEFLVAAAQLVDLRSWLAVLLNASLKGGLILVLALAALHFHRRSPASVRHWIGATAICTLLLLPVASALLPSWDVPLMPRPALFEEQASPPGLAEYVPKAPGLQFELDSSPGRLKAPSSLTAEIPPADSKLAALQQLNSTVSAPGAEDRESSSRNYLAIWMWLQENWSMAAFLLWLGGASLLLARLAIAMLYVAWLAGRCCLTPQSHWQKVAQQMAGKMGIRRKVQILFSPRLQVALSVGLWKPTVILPASAQTWSPRRMRSILLHELAHVRRWDNLVNLASQLACALYWFNPLTWRLAGQVMVDREQACDDAVLQFGTRASEYAGHLLEVATASLPGRRSLWRPVEVSQSSALKDRLQAILDRKLSRAPLGKGALAFSLFSILLLAPLAAFRPWLDPALSISGLALSEDQVGLANKRDPYSIGSIQSGRFRPQPQRHSAAAPGENRAAQTLTGRPSDSKAVPSPVSKAKGWSPRTILAQAVSRDSWQPEGFERAGLERFLGRAVKPTGLPLAGPHLRPQAPLIARSAEGAASPPNGNSAQSGRESSPIIVPGRVLDRRDPPPPSETPEEQPKPAPEPAPAPEPEPEPEPEKVLVQRSLGTLGGGVSQGLAISKSGQVAGFSTTKTGEMRPFIWDPSRGMVDLGTLGGHGGEYCGLDCWEFSGSARAVGINQRGEVIGISPTAEGEVHAFFWSEQDGMIDLGTLGGSLSEAFDINESGQVSGYSTDQFGRQRAFFWSRESGMIDLSPAESSESLGAAINDFGQVVGSVDGHAFLWTPEDGMHRLTDDLIFSEAVDINNQGQVAGQAAFIRNQMVAFVWDPDSGLRPLGTLGEESQESYSYSVSINEAGQVAGRSLVVRDLALGDIITRTFFWSHESGMVDVDSFGSDPSLNNAGQIAGRRATDPESKSIRGYLWSPQGVVELGKVEEGYDLSWPRALNDQGAIAGVALPEDGRLITSDIEYQAVIWQFVPQQPAPGLPLLQEAARQLEREAEGFTQARKNTKGAN